MEIQKIMPEIKNMLIEVTNRCNQACVFCAHKKMKRKKGDISVSLAERIMREAYEMGNRQVGLYTTGEVFLHPNICEIIKSAKKLGYEYIYSDTNGAFATKERLISIFEAGLDSIKFSINAGTKKTYQKIHGRDDFDMVIQNFNDCAELKDRFNFKLLVSYIVTKDNKDEICNLRDLLQDKADDIWTSDCHNQFGQMIGGGQRMNGCSMLFNRAHITHEGYLTACCADFENYLAIEDLNKMSLVDAWNSSRFNRLRDAHINNTLEGTLCYNCLNDIVSDISPINASLVEMTGVS